MTNVHSGHEGAGENLREPLFNGKGKFLRDSKPQAGAIWHGEVTGLHFQRSVREIPAGCAGCAFAGMLASSRSFRGLQA